MMRFRRGALSRSCLVLLTITSLAHTAFARDLFTSAITITSLGSDSAGRNDIRQVDQLFQGSGFEDLFPEYVGTEEVRATIDMRGVGLLMRYPDNSAVLDIVIPAIDLHLSIDPADFFPFLGPLTVPQLRVETEMIFKEWLEGDRDLEDTDPSTGSSGATTLAPVLAKMVELSPVEPVAGNPNALDSRMIYGDFRMAMESQFLPEPGEAPLEAKIRTAFEFNTFSSGPYSGNGYDFDIGIEFGTPTPRVSVLLDLPFTVTTAEGGKSYMASGALGLVTRLTPYWNLIPAIRVGVAGSFQVGALAVLYQFSLASTLTFEVCGFDLLIGNMFTGGSNIGGIEYDGFVIDYDLETFAFTNGFEFGRSLGIEIAKLRPEARLYFIATNFIGGGGRYTPHHYETGLLLTSPVRSSSLDRLGLKLGYLGGEGYNSFKLSFSGHW